MIVRLLALDLATRLGWASGDSEVGDPVSGAHLLPSTGEDVGSFLDAYHRWLVETLKATQPDMIIMEAPIPAMGNSNMSTLMKLWGLCSHTEFVSAHKGIECRQIYAVSWKAGVLGDSKARKPRLKKQLADYAAIRVCHEYGWEHVMDDNEADALCIWLHAVRLCDPKSAVRFDPLFRAEQFKLTA